MRALAKALSAACAAALLGAAVLACDGGTSSETVGLGGKVELRTGSEGITGTADPGSQVGLYAEGYHPHRDSGYADSVTAGGDGSFSFAGLAPGIYNVVVRRSDGLAAFLGNLAVPGDREAGASLDSTGILRGIINDTGDFFDAFAFLPGTPFFARADTLAHFEVPGIPVGDYRVIRAWKRLLPCDTAVCGGIESLQDSAILRFRAGDSTGW